MRVDSSSQARSSPKREIVGAVVSSITVNESEATQPFSDVTMMVYVPGMVASSVVPPLTVEPSGSVQTITGLEALLIVATRVVLLSSHVSCPHERLTVGVSVSALTVNESEALQPFADVAVAV